MTSRALERMVMNAFGGVSVSVHHANPGSDGGGMLIITDTVVHANTFSLRQGSIVNTSEILVGIAPRGSRLTHGGIWDRGGGFLLGGRLRIPVVVAEGDIVIVPSGAIIVDIEVA